MAARPPGPGRLLTGTSGFAYPDWAPRFYPSGLRNDQLLSSYAARLPACELNSTYYRWPRETQVGAWAAQVPPGFRFSIKAQRSAAWRAMHGTAREEIRRLVAPLAAFGPRLGTVLFRIPEEVPRDDSALATLLDAWPAAIPLALELQHSSWQVDETFAALRRHGVALCATELPEDPDPPTIRLTGSFLYVRLRRHDYGPAELAAWAARLRPFLDAGSDAYAFFRHDAVGRGAELARALIDALYPGEECSPAGAWDPEPA